MSLNDKIVTLLSYLYPQKIFSFSSQYTDCGIVWKINGKNELFVDGIRQSGGKIDELWKRTFRNFDTDVFKKARSILIVGIGGVSVFRLIRTLCLDTPVDLVDIDSEVVKVAKLYFGLESLRPRTTYCQNIQIFTEKNKGRSYDVIILDVYTGNHVPDFVTTPAFIRNLQRLLTPKGTVLINYFDDTEIKKEKILEHLLYKFFPDVTPIHVFRNVMFLASL